MRFDSCDKTVYNICSVPIFHRLSHAQYFCYGPTQTLRLRISFLNAFLKSLLKIV